MYVDEDSWKRFVPSVRLLKDYGSGWAMVGDLLLCLPLSVFVQFTQINYKVSTCFHLDLMPQQIFCCITRGDTKMFDCPQVDDLEEYLNDPVKQHYLVRSLPARMKRQLLYKR